MDTPVPSSDEEIGATTQRDREYLHQLQSHLIELAYDAIIVRDETSTILSWNRGAQQLYGWSAQEAIGKTTHTLFQTRFPESREALDRFLSTGEHWQGELEHMRKDGTRVIVESRQVLLRDAQNQLVALLEINRDITARKKREQEHLHQLAALVESAAIPIISKTRDGVITSWNKAAERLYGYRAQEAVGQPITLIFPADRQDEFSQIMEHIRRGEQVDLYETLRRRKDGSIVPVSVTVSPLYDEQGQISGASSIAHDITERTRIQAQERFLTRVSKVLSSSLDYQETLTNIAHLVVPELADWFIIDLIDEQGRFERLTLVHEDPERVRSVQLVRNRYPLDTHTATGAARVLRTGQGELYREITEAMLVASARNEEELALARQVGYSSVMTVPLISRGTGIGVVSFVAAESGKHYDERDLALAEEIGRRAGIALDHARLYREAQQARDQLTIILQGVADGIFVYAPDSRLLYANEAAAQMTGFASVQDMLATEPLAITNQYLLVDEHSQPFLASHLTHLRVFAGEPEAQAIMGYTRTGNSQPERWSLVKSRPVRDEHGVVSMVVTITQDITARMQAEQRKDAFISMASHELNTPVTSLKGFVYILRRRLAQQEDPLIARSLERIDAQLDRLASLIRDLLDVSRMQSGKLTLRKTAFELDPLVAEIVAQVQATTTTHQIGLEGQTDAQIFGDQDRLGQVFLNLLTNALKYSPQAERVVVRLQRQPSSAHAIVRIQDFGIGIDPTHHPHIFERFYQVSDPEATTYPGLGIGLSIAQEIVERHHGWIEIESRKGAGSTFSVVLPVLAAAQSGQISEKEEETHAADSQADSRGGR